MWDMRGRKRVIGLLLVCVLAGKAAVGRAEGKKPVLSVSGTLLGYFLQPTGELVKRSLPFPAPRPEGGRLLPVWAGYYLQLRVSAGEAFTQLEVRSGNGWLVFRREYASGVREAQVPGYEGTPNLRPSQWIGVP